MEDWKSQVAYFNSYHAYTFLHQSEQSPENQTGSSGNRVTDFSSCTDGATQTVYPAATSGRIGESQRYHESGLVYVGGTQTDHLLPPGPHGGDGTDLRRASSGSTSDIEARTTPDSWGSVSSREGSLLQTDLSIWVKKDDDLEGIARSPEDNRDVSSSVVEEPQALVNSPTFPNVPLSTSKTSFRTTFSPSQLEALSKSFSAQKYLNPAEMKDLAKQTGLTYKQVKTWFQNRRMKLRKCQRDISWASDRYASRCYATPYPIDGQPQLREHYNQHAVEAAYKKSPHDLAYCPGTSSTGFTHWSSNSPQTARWPMTPGGNPYVPIMFNSSNFVHSPSSESKDGNQMVGQESVNAAVVPYVNQ